MALLTTYQTLLALSQRMVERAAAEEWDALVSMEAERSALLAQLPAQLPAMPQSEGRSIAQAIQGILDCNKSIEEYVKPWMEHVGSLLATFGSNPRP